MQKKSSLLVKIIEKLHLNNNQHNDIQYNNTQHNNIQHDTQLMTFNITTLSIMTPSTMKESLYWVSFILSVTNTLFMLSV
jgi:hypothetical protein